MRFTQRKIHLIIAGTCIACFSFGCAKPPAAELAAAKAAVQAAKDVEADKYMVNNFLNLKKAMESAEADIAAQKKAVFFARNYKHVIEKLGKIANLAGEIKDEAPKIKADMVAQVKENVRLSKGLLEATANDIKKFERKTDKNIIAELKGDLSNAESTAAAAATAFEAGDVFGAKEKLEEVQRLMKKITDTLKPKTEEQT